MILRFLLLIVLLPISSLLVGDETERSQRVESSIEAALRAPSRLSGTAISLGELLLELREQYPFNVVIDFKALESEGIAARTPLEAVPGGLSLQDQLRLRLSPLGLTFEIRHEVLSITTESEADIHFVARLYRVNDLTDPSDIGHPENERLEEVVRLIRQTSWRSEGGAGQIEVINGCLLVSNTWETHQKIERLLTALRAVRKRSQGPNASESTPASLPPLFPTAIQESLKTFVTIRAARTPLGEVLEDLANQLEAPLYCHPEARWALTERIQLQVTEVSCRHALELLLEPLELRWMYQDGVLMIASADVWEVSQQVRVYDVGEAAKANYWNVDERESPINLLVSSMQDAISAENWSIVGGSEEIVVFGKRILVISARRKTHEQIEDFLKQLRSKMQEVDRQHGHSRLVLRKYDLTQRIRNHYWHHSSAYRDELSEEPGWAVRQQILTYELARVEGLAEKLAKILPRAIHPESWKGSGASIQAHQGILLIRQTPLVLYELEERLKQLKLWRRPFYAPGFDSDGFQGEGIF